jgi:hypothetical protein
MILIEDRWITAYVIALRKRWFFLRQRENFLGERYDGAVNNRSRDNKYLMQRKV